jgi:hypothetical protein
MEQCIVCGAALRQGDGWCGQCYAPRNTSHPSYHGPGAIDTREIADPRFATPTQPFEVKFSRLRGGPTSMGVAGRVLTSILAVLLACAVYLYIFPVIIGEASRRTLLLFLVPAVPVLLAVLRRVWRPHRIS